MQAWQVLLEKLWVPEPASMEAATVTGYPTALLLHGTVAAGKGG
jgi:hypothetical protein